MELIKYKKSINDSDFDDEQIKVIWEFYVTKALTDSASQRRKIQEDYGYKNIPLKDMKILANFKEENYKMLLADKMEGTLKKLNLLFERELKDLDIPRAVFIAPYYIEDENKPKAKKGEGEILLEHIRNSFAHGNTYFFENGMMLLEDKNGNKITARILVKQKVLLDWINLIDKEQKYYIIRQV